MGISTFLEAAIDGRPVPLFGDGSQIRDFTFVADVVAANVAAGSADVPAGSVLNVAGGGSISVAELLALIGELVGTAVTLDRLPEQPGDVRATGGDIDRARQLLGWQPVTDIRAGVAAQLEWLRNVAGLHAS
jgi:nucleoside-diphosphate-sugar epimerase